MSSSLRILMLAALGAIACGAGLRAAEALLPPEPTTGEWIADTFADDSLWFAASANLEFEPLADGLRSYAPGRRWIHVVDGQAAWVMYYVPGEILGFEVDTHHFGAQATDFRFSAGRSWDELAPVAVDYEEITGFEAKWMRLYRTARTLPPETQFLRIAFPEGTDVAAARLTEVWLRCSFKESEPIAPAAAVTTIAPAQSPPATAPKVVSPPPLDEEIVVEPIVVRGVWLDAPAPPPPAPIFSPAMAEPATPAVELPDPWSLTRLDVVGEFAPLPEPPTASRPAQDLFSNVVAFFRDVF